MSGYTIRWQRSGEDEVYECAGLDPRTALARLILALRDGPVTVHEVSRTDRLTEGN